MKIREILEQQPAKITKVQPGRSAEVDHGDGSKTTIDLKKNPSALSKDDEGNVTLNKPSKPGEKKKDPAKLIRPGDIVKTTS